jgi:hypothetical protein
VSDTLTRAGKKIQTKALTSKAGINKQQTVFSNGSLKDPKQKSF